MTDFFATNGYVLVYVLNKIVVEAVGPFADSIESDVLLKNLPEEKRNRGGYWISVPLQEPSAIVDVANLLPWRCLDENELAALYEGKAGDKEYLLRVHVAKCQKCGECMEWLEKTVALLAVSPAEPAPYEALPEQIRQSLSREEYDKFNARERERKKKQMN